MKRFLALAGVISLAIGAIAYAQGVNPVTPPTGSMIQIQQPAFINPSNLYTTPALLGPTLSVPAANLTGTTLASGVTASSLTSVGTLASATVTGAVTSGSSTSNSYSSNGTLPTLTGTCAVVAGTRVGGATAGSFAVPAGNCIAGTTVIVALPTATNGWACDAHELTVPTSIFDQTATGTASITFTIRTVTANAGDVVVWKCMGY
jgi:hypothetical protein